MIYCPNCATRLNKELEVCPYCKKVLDIKVLKQFFTTKDSSRFNRGALSKIWFKEHGHIIIPIVMLVIGLGIGTAISFGYASVQYQGKASDFETRISDLQAIIEQSQSAAGDIRSEMKDLVDSQDKVISVLNEQKKLLGQIISFTNRLSRNSTVQPDTTSEADFYTRNVRYLISQFEEQEMKLEEMGVTSEKPRTLMPIPQLLEQGSN